VDPLALKPGPEPKRSVKKGATTRPRPQATDKRKPSAKTKAATSARHAPVKDRKPIDKKKEPKRRSR